MKAVVVTTPGGPEVLSIVDRPTPTPGPREVLIKVHAAGINRPDCAQRQGTYPPPTGATDILGLEVAGTVEACGDEVIRWKKGDAVCALLVGGGYAEYAVAPEGQCLPIPYDLDFVHAASLPETFFTVWTNVFESGRLQNGESILIHGGSGGIGTTAIQMAHHFGATVFTTVGKKESVEVCKSLGADHVILYKEEDFVSAVKVNTAGRGVDVILDMVGGPYFTRNVESLAPQGRLVQIATIQGTHAEIDLRKMMLKRLTFTGSTLRARPIEEKSRIAAALEKNVWPAIASGKMKPEVFKVFSIEQVQQAHELMESSQHTGKIVLKISW